MNSGHHTKGSLGQKIKGQGKGMITQHDTKGTLRQNFKRDLRSGRKGDFKARHKRDLTLKQNNGTLGQGKGQIARHDKKRDLTPKYKTKSTP